MSEGAPKGEQQEETRSGPVMSRRNLLASGLTGAVLATMVKVAPEAFASEQVGHIDAGTDALSQNEAISQHERFVEVVSGYRALYAMQNSVLFIDKRGAPVGIVRIEPVGDVSPGASYQEVYGKDGGGVVTEGFAGEWLNAAETLVLEEHPELTADDVSLVTNWDELNKAVNNPNESMTRENTRSIMDIVHYFGNKPVRGAEHMTRIEYVRDKIEFTGNLAKAENVVSELRRLIPGMCALESHFNDDVSSSADAHGIFEFKKSTWVDELGRKPFTKDHPVSLVEQTKAAGELFSKMYYRFMYWCYEEENYGGQNYLEDIKQLFASQKEFEQCFFVPCLLNAYNTGEKGMGDVVIAYVQSSTFRDRLKQGRGSGGFDVFEEMTEFARNSKDETLSGYNDDASTYSQKIYAYTGLLEADNTPETMLVAQE